MIPEGAVEPELLADLDSVLRPSETLTDLAEASPRSAIAFRRVQTDFATYCEASLAGYERTGVSIPAEQVIGNLESMLAKRRKQLGG
jgi:hypothetical protein